MPGESSLPSVTRILATVGLIDYSYIPPDARELLLERGRLVHEAIALDLEDDLDESSATESGVLGYVLAARAARAALGPLEVLAIEHEVVHTGLGYTGRVDLHARIGRRDAVIDWKTNSAEYWVRFQLAAYAAALCDARAPYARRIAVELHDDGQYMIYECGPESYHDDLTTFIAALRVYNEKLSPRRLR